MKFIYLNDDDSDPLAEEAQVTWYDARARHASRSEHRLYFPATSVSQRSAEGDLLVIAKRQDDSALIVIARRGSTIANQIRWLFRVPEALLPGFSIREEMETDQDRIEFASAFILEQIGIVVETSEETYLDAMIAKFNGAFPSTREFSDYARSTLPDVDDRDNPDAAIMAWIEREEILFRTLEKHLLTERLSEGFADAESFLQFSLSVINRRKSRAGLALENHLEAALASNDIRYGRAAATEGKARPDFLFPGAREYREPSFDPSLLSMLAAKSTCKDRWRQVLTEARRIPDKHLITLEAAISRDQTNQMREHRVQLVIPRKLQATFAADQVPRLMDLNDFVHLVRNRQNRALY